MGLRYSQIVETFYRIVLTDDFKDMLDTHFTGSAHHLHRFNESITVSCRIFHLHRHRLHLRLMMRVVYQFGIFTNSQDPSNRGLERREMWDHNMKVMPEPNMFSKMLPDPHYPLGAEHPADHYLHDEEWLNFFFRERN